MYWHVRYWLYVVKDWCTRPWGYVSPGRMCADFERNPMLRELVKRERLRWKNRHADSAD